MKVSVNVSPDHLRQSDFALRLGVMLRRYPSVPPANLELEILESVSLGDVEHASRTLAECLALGVQFSLDDFGTGYSSLTYLSAEHAGPRQKQACQSRTAIPAVEDLRYGRVAGCGASGRRYFSPKRRVTVLQPASKKASNTNSTAFRLSSSTLRS